MKTLLSLFIFLFSTSVHAQLTLSPSGFNSVTVEKPNKTDDKFIELSRSWAAMYNQDINYPYEIANVTANSFDIDGQQPNAFYYRNRGEAFYHRVKYSMHIELKDKTYTIKYVAKEIYTSNVLTEMTTSSIFAPDGRLKEEYLDVKPSFEKSVNSIVKSFVDYMATY